MLRFITGPSQWRRSFRPFLGVSELETFFIEVDLPRPEELIFSPGKTLTFARQERDRHVPARPAPLTTAPTLFAQRKTASLRVPTGALNQGARGQETYLNG